MNIPIDIEKQILSLENIPLDLLGKQITYLPFKSVKNLCQTSKKLNSFCNATSDKSSLIWKNIIRNTYSRVPGYKKALKKISMEICNSEECYNYRVYVNLINLLSDYVQLMIFYRQGDMDSFNDSKYTDVDRFMAMKELRDVQGIKKYGKLYEKILRDISQPDAFKTMTVDKVGKLLVDFVKYGDRSAVEDIAVNFRNFDNIPNWDRKSSNEDFFIEYEGDVKDGTVFEEYLHKGLEEAILRGDTEIMDIFLDHYGGAIIPCDYIFDYALNTPFEEKVYKYALEYNCFPNKLTQEALVEDNKDRLVDLILKYSYEDTDLSNLILNKFMFGTITNPGMIKIAEEIKRIERTYEDYRGIYDI